MVYNFEVEDFHTYYVGKKSILVHNLCTARRKAVRGAWKNEYNNVKNGGQGISRAWSMSEQVELLSTGKVKGYYGHHMKSVSGYPELAGNPSNIQFLSYANHFKAHGGDWRNVINIKFME